MSDVADQFSNRTTWGYEVEFEPVGMGRVDLHCPALPELSTSGRDMGDAFRKAHEALDQAISRRVAQGQDVPPFDRLEQNSDSTWVVTLRAIHVIKVELHMALRAQGITRAALMRHLGWHRTQVDRLFDFDRDTQLDHIQRAANALGLNPNWRLKANLDASAEPMAQDAPALQLSSDGDGWRVRLAPADPTFAGDPLTPEAFASEADAIKFAQAIERALAQMGFRIQPRRLG